MNVSLYSTALHSTATESNSTTGEPPTKPQVNLLLRRKKHLILLLINYKPCTYKTRPPPTQNDWPNYCITKYVKLGLIEKPDKTHRADHEHHIGMLELRGGVDKIQEERKHLTFNDLSEIFCNSNDRLILIMGGPGEY